MFKGAEAARLKESLTCTVICDVVALSGTAVAESFPSSESFNHDGRGDAAVQWKGPTPVPATVCKDKLRPLLMLKVRSDADSAATARRGATAIVKS